MDLVLSRMVEDAIGEDIYRERFEKAIKEQMQFENAIAFRSPYSAFVKAIEICDLPRRAKIAIPALAPDWQRIAVDDAGFEAHIFDVDEVSLHPQIEDIREANPSMVVLFDALGVRPSAQFMKELNIPIIEDVSQALGEISNEKASDSNAHFFLWNMEADSAIATGGGGLLCARGKRDAQILRALNESMPSELKMTDYNAALGLSQLRSYSQMMERRKGIYDLFKAQLSRTRHLTLTADGEFKSAYAFPILSETSAKDIVEYAKKYGVQVLPAFASSAAMLEDDAERLYPRSRNIALRCLLFPMHHKLTNQQVDQISKIIATLP